MGIPAPAGIAASGLPPAGDQANAVLQGTFKNVGVTQPFAFRGPMNLALWASAGNVLTTTAGSLAASVASGTGFANGSAIKSANVPPGTIASGLAGTNLNLLLPAVTIYGLTNTSSAQISGLASTAGLAGATVAGPGLPAGTTVLAILVPAVPANLNSAGYPGTISISADPTSAPSVVTAQPFTFSGLTGAAITATGADAAASFTDAALMWDATVQIERSFDGGYTWVVCNTGAGTLAQYIDLSSVSLTFGEPERNVLYRLNCIEFTLVEVAPIIAINYRISQTGGAAESLAIGPLS
jgi:hypothetical protein